MVKTPTVAEKTARCVSVNAEWHGATASGVSVNTEWRGATAGGVSVNTEWHGATASRCSEFTESPEMAFRCCFLLVFYAKCAFSCISSARSDPKAAEISTYLNTAF